MLQKIIFDVYDDTEIFFNEYSSNDSFLLSYRQLGFIRTKSTYKNMKEGFSECFFLFLIDGSMSLTYEGKTYLLEPNSLFLIDSKKKFELSENSDGSSVYFVYVKGKHMDLIYNVFAQSYKSPIIKDAKNLKDPFASLYRNVKEMNYSNLNEEDAKIVINGYLYEFISKVMYEVEKRKFEVSSIDNVVNYIYENYQKEITVDQLAKMSGYSKFHFIKLFKAKYNETPARFVNIYRAKRALNVIVAENKTVEQSAYDAGFKDKRALIRICKNTFGTLPSKLTKRGFDQKINS